MISIEQKILACSADLNPDPYQQQRMRHLMSHDIDVDHLINMAIKEGRSPSVLLFSTLFVVYFSLHGPKFIILQKNFANLPCL